MKSEVIEKSNVQLNLLHAVLKRSKALCGQVRIDPENIAFVIFAI